MSGTLFEGIERWSQRKATITHEDTKRRAHSTIGLLRDHGIQHVRTHIDVTDPTLGALKSMLEVKEEARNLIDLQIVAFPQEGIESFPDGRKLMEQAIDMLTTLRRWSATAAGRAPLPVNRLAAAVSAMTRFSSCLTPASPPRS